MSTKFIPIVGRSKPDLRVYNVLINCGAVENARITTTICQHAAGFNTAEEALISLHKALKKAYVEDYTTTMADSWVEDSIVFAEWIMKACNGSDDQNHIIWEVMRKHGWYFPGNLVTGLTIEITVNGENVLNTEQNIIDHCKAHKGELVPLRKDSPWPLISDLRIFVLTVGELTPNMPSGPVTKFK